MATMQMCKPTPHVEAKENNCCAHKCHEKPQKSHCDKTTPHKVTQPNNGCKSSEKKHLGHFWHRHGNHNNSEHKTAANTKHQVAAANTGHQVAAANKQTANTGHQVAAANKQAANTGHLQVAAANKHHRFGQCFGHSGKPVLGDDYEEEGMVVCIERKEEKVVTIMHAKKSHLEHLDAHKYLNKC